MSWWEKGLDIILVKLFIMFVYSGILLPVF